jgi:hypothetical protein
MGAPTQKPTVSVSEYSYLVTDAYGKQFTVGKDKSCSCGKEGCWHVRQVRDYLKGGGKKAPNKPEVTDDLPYIDDVFFGSPYRTTPQTFECPAMTPVSESCIAEITERVGKIKAAKEKMESDPVRNMHDKAGYWMDLRSLSGIDMCQKWNLHYDYRES